jgi:hypothetical protein
VPRFFALQFFFYYVFWSFVLGFGSTYNQIMAPDFYWYFLLGWLGLWLIPPLGTLRRRFQAQLGLELRKEQKAGQDTISPLFANLALAMVMLLAMIVGGCTAPTYLEAMDVDVGAKLEGRLNVGRD